MLAVLRSDRNGKHSTFSLVHGTLHPIHANPLEVIVLLSLYLAVLDDQSKEEQFIDVYNGKTSIVRRLFSFAVVRQIIFIIKERADSKQLKSSAYYRLCVCASGSLIIDILNCLILIKVSCLHLGQNKGKFLSIVSPRIRNLVLFLHIGQFTHSIFSISSPYPNYFLLIER